MGQKSPYCTRAARSNGAVQRSGAVNILRVRIGTGFNEADNCRCLRRRIPCGRTGISDCRRMKGFSTAPVPRSDVGISLDQCVRHLLAVGSRGEM